MLEGDPVPRDVECEVAPGTAPTPAAREPMGKPPGGYAARDTERRRRWAERHLGQRLEDPGPPEPESLRGIIEQHVGYVPVPMALAAPLLIEGTYARGEFAVPLCTVEGTLTVSMTRGMLAMARGGGCRAVHRKQELARSPYFRLPGPDAAGPFVAWVAAHFEAIRRAAEATTRHGRLLRIDPVPMEGWVVLDFVYDTGNAAGQNMVTLATEAACRLIARETGYPHGIESGYNSDKKASRRNLDQGRAHAVVAEATLPPEVLATLGITAAQALAFQEVATASARAIGMLGTNLHLANALAAIYLATGQDVACVAENCVGYSHVEPAADGGLHARVTLPSLTVGTVGGGTRLPAQRRNLGLLGCLEGPHAARKLAEIVAGSVLALEISLLAALVSNQFAAAHRKYGRPHTTGG
jgi:hydroxymethylglutaryl-CoA reductase (NADPH)